MPATISADKGNPTNKQETGKDEGSNAIADGILGRSDDCLDADVQKSARKQAAEQKAATGLGKSTPAPTFQGYACRAYQGTEKAHAAEANPDCSGYRGQYRVGGRPAA